MENTMDKFDNPSQNKVFKNLIFYHRGPHQ